MRKAHNKKTDSAKPKLQVNKQNHDYIVKKGIDWIAFISLLVSVASLFVTLFISCDINDFSKSVSRPIYSLEITPPDALASNGTSFSLGPFKVKLAKEQYSGKASKIYWATVVENSLQLAELIECKNVADTLKKIVANPETVEKYGVTVVTDIKQEHESFLFDVLWLDPRLNATKPPAWGISHIVIEGVNGQFTYYTVIYAYGINPEASRDGINPSETATYVIQETELYDRAKMKSIASTLSSSTNNITIESLQNQIENERIFIASKLS